MEHPDMWHWYDPVSKFYVITSYTPYDPPDHGFGIRYNCVICDTINDLYGEGWYGYVGDDENGEMKFESIEKPKYPEDKEDHYCKNVLVYHPNANVIYDSENKSFDIADSKTREKMKKAYEEHH